MPKGGAGGAGLGDDDDDDDDMDDKAGDKLDDSDMPPLEDVKK